ncbi:alpha/beta hydrolase [Thomasclavelia sp.]|uniref:alpha/beta hydrolase n=1 Tax=Thomasclavelia sp. TaxID=3025757 RepID=UPI0025FA7476|nr:alpha/beta hydrolase [Thomasclavelia sp.]
MNKNKKRLATSLAVVAGIASSAGALNAFANKMVKAMLYRHHKEDDKPSILETKYASINVYLKNYQGIRLRGILIEEQNADTTLVILHPFALEAKDMTLYVPFFKERYPKWNILLVDACGHGQSDGYIRGLGIKDVRDLISWNRFILKTYGKDHKIVLYGKEAGANTILKAASEHSLKNVKAIISDGAYTSVYDILGYRLIKDYKVPKFPTIQLIKAKIKKEIKINIKTSYVDMVKHNDIPTLYVHMKEDDFVPLKMVYPLYNANRGSKVLFVLKDERYLYELTETDEFKNTMTNFITKYVK